MNSALHYTSTLMVATEALIARGVPPKNAAVIGIMVARADEMVDWYKPKRATLDCPATQVDVRDPVSAAMVATGGTYPLMSRGHTWHFDPENGWPAIEMRSGLYTALTTPGPLSPEIVNGSDDRWMALGALLHTAQDTDGPHKNYVGKPCQANYELAVERMTARGERISLWDRCTGKVVPWGHAVDENADRIENCRKGAEASMCCLHGLLSGGVIDSHGCIVVDGKGRGEDHSLFAIVAARNDDDLEELQRKNFHDLTGKDMPPFVPFSGLELQVWRSVVK